MLTASLNQSRTIGCEFEMIIPSTTGCVGSQHDVQANLAGVLSHNGIQATTRPYSHQPIPSGYDVVVEYDSSIRPTSRLEGMIWCPLEVKTRILEGCQDWEDVVPRMLSICKHIGCRVNRTTGHHLHIGVPEVDHKPSIIKSIYNWHYRYQNVLFGLVTRSRHENPYCEPLPELPEMQRARSLSSLLEIVRTKCRRRYYLNLMHLGGYGSRVEYRLHQGTLNIRKARHWMRLCLRLVDHCVTRRCQARESEHNTRDALERMFIAIGLRSNSGIYSTVDQELAETRRYLTKRWIQFDQAEARRRAELDARWLDQGVYEPDAAES